MKQLFVPHPVVLLTPILFSCGFMVLATAAHAATPLAETPVPFDAASGKTPATPKETVPCPFLTDKTALATVKTRRALPRTKVSNTECVWRRNAGFVLRVSIEPADGAKPFAERHYNMDRKTQVDLMPGPADDAVLLSHTTWGKPIAYALGFKQDGKAVFIKATGLKASREQLQATANEVAALLPDAKKIEAQHRTTKPAFDNCSTWDAASLGALLKLPADLAVKTTGGRTYCNWEFGEKGKYGYPHGVSISYGRYSKRSWDKLQKKQGATPVSGYDQPVLRVDRDDKYGRSFSRFAQFAKRQMILSVVDRTGGDPSPALDTLFENILQRLQR